MRSHLRFTFSLLGLGLMFGGCTTVPKVMNLQSRQSLFPEGIYEHKVELTFSSKAGQKRQSFHGIVQLSLESLQFNALSPFGTTVFRLTENRKTGDIQFENFVSDLAPFETQIRLFYSLVRAVLTAPFEIKPSETLSVLAKDDQGLPRRLQIHALKSSAVVELQKYDEQKIPREIHVQHEQFQIQIEVVSYDPIPLH
jgi:hypothetical protein